MGTTADEPMAREMTPEAEAAETEAPETAGAFGPCAPVAATRLFGPRGRHRRPRPRKVLLAAGGLALAAGALSLVRPTPDSGITGSLGTTESGPPAAPALDTAPQPDRTANAATALPTTPRKPTPTATSAMGGRGATSALDSIVVPTPPNTATTPRRPTVQPATPTPQPPGTATPPSPPPAQEPSDRPPTTTPPAQPTQPDDDPVCVPVIGLCVDPLQN
ncbi:hypothetical protein IM697_39145 [Streptomyces ferrugineus]|uniref:Uncharacterized protein n=1 Tax=Streptomyces ferrugineus TaxID=1413221 RepID=A0A7M2SIY4_9ACTN|nr:hypothetical protein [Streptomyces ferrugineus]QOV35989.1 hypothetical protein IM697_39145 [Streptomyces ferrugineus]